MNAKLRNYLPIWLSLWLAMSLWACEATRHLEPGQYLLRDAPAIEHDKKVPKDALEEAVRTEPNRRMLLPKTYLHLYNLGQSIEQDSSWIKRNLMKVKRYRRFIERTSTWLRTGIGEAPVVIDSAKLEEDAARLRNVCFARGYFHPEVSYQVNYLNSLGGQPKANVSFEVKEGVAYKIREIAYFSEVGRNSALEWHYNKGGSLLREGENYSEANLINERSRATNALRNRGFFTFGQQMIDYRIDTLLPANQAKADSLKPLHKLFDLDIHLNQSPTQYTIREVQVNLKPPDINRIEQGFSIELRADALNDSLRELLELPYRKLTEGVAVTFVVDRRLMRELNYNFIAQRIHLYEGELYTQSNARLTQARLQELGMFQFIVVNYVPIDSLGLIDVNIDIQLGPRYQMKVGFETFTNDITSTNLPSVGASLSMRNKNTFGKSELLELSFKGNVGFYAAEEGESQFDQLFYEVGATSNLNFPRFLLPSPLRILIPPKIRRDLSRYSPTTIFGANFQRESRFEYQRLSTGLNLNYRWNHIPFKDIAVSRLTPLAVEFIDIPEERIDPGFQREVLDNLPPVIRRDFEARFSTRFKYSYTQQDYRTSRAAPTTWTQVNLEFGGNVPYFLDRWLPSNDGDFRDNRLFDRFFYGQYVKGALEGRVNFPIGKQADLVLRSMVGASTPYNRTPTVPQESRFFSGGTNGMRGWQSNTLGPGKSRLSDFQGADTTFVSSLIAPGGEWILEMNAEFRQKLNSWIELALFTDLGNVWFNNTAQTREQLGESSVLSLENFVLGWDAGAGIRFDFTFILLRLDLAQQLYAPDLNPGWVFRNDAKRPVQINLGIGYPF